MRDESELLYCHWCDGPIPADETACMHLSHGGAVWHADCYEKDPDIKAGRFKGKPSVNIGKTLP